MAQTPRKSTGVRKSAPRKAAASKKTVSTRQARRAVEREAAKVKAKRETELIAKRGGTATSASEWRKGRQGVLIVLPSGNVCKAINKGMEAFLRAGRIPNDLMPIITGALNEAEGRPSKKAGADYGKKIMEDPALLSSALDLMDTVVCECVQDPVILPIPKKTIKHPPDDDHPEEWEEVVEIPIAERVDPGEALWVDECDMTDKQFILNWVMGGTQDIAQFREELADVMDDLQPGDEDKQEAE